jgi:hypothetical protein
LNRLANPRTEEEKLISQSLPQDIKKNLKSQTNVYIELDPKKLHSIFYKKQEYEPFAIPMAYPVLEDINAKLELKKIDMAIARTTDWSILLLTMGDKDLPNTKNIQAMQELMQNESVKRVLISDWTTKGEWLIPDIGKILGKEKYEQLDQDIQTGLNNIVFNTDEKFSNTTIKVQVFVERLREARNAFLNDFLQPEVDRVCKLLGFRKIPTLKFEEISLKDDVQWARIYTRLLELGAITPEETFQAIETGQLPTDKEQALLSQESFKELREKGLYTPMLNNKQAEKDGAKDNGRPEGSSGVPQSTKNVSPIGQGDQSKASAFFDINLLKQNMVKASELRNALDLALRKKFSIRKLNKEQESMATMLTNSILANESKDCWFSKIDEYIESPIAIKDTKAIDEIRAEHDTSEELAILLFLSKKA